MATNYPGSLDNFTNPTSASPINSPSHADQHSNANDAIEAIEGELGTNPKGAKATVKVRLDDVDTAIALKAPIASPTFTGTVTIPAGSAITGVPYLATANIFTGNNTFASPIVGFVGTSGSYLSTPVSAYNIIHLSQGMIFINSQTGGDYNLGTNTYYNSGWKYFESAGSTLINFGNGRFDFSTAPSGTAGNAITYTSKMMIANSGTVTINGFGAAAQGLIVKAAASQTANLQEWQASDGTVYGRFNAFGSLYVSNNTEGGTAQFGNTGFASASSVVLKVKGSASQTADLQQWQNSAGTVLAKVTSDGSVQTPGISVQYGIYSTTVGKASINPNYDTGAMGVYSEAAANKALVVRGFASQTANLQQWQNSSGTVFVQIGSGGDLYMSSATRAFFGGSDTAGYVNISTAGNGGRQGLVIKGAPSQTANLLEFQSSTGGLYSRFDSVGQYQGVYAVLSSDAVGTLPLKVKGASGQTANLTEWQDSSGGLLTAINNSGQIATFGRLTVGSSVVSTDARMVLLNTGTTTSVLQIIRGIASQTADLQQWQDSAGSVLSRVQADGTIVWGSASSSLQNSSGRLIVNLGSAASVGITVKGAASQTADLQQWQNSAGTVLASISPSGYLTLPGIISGAAGINSSASVGINIANFTSSAQLAVSTAGASYLGIVVRGFASQTANLQEWQNSSGTVLANVDSSGKLTVSSGVIASTEFYSNGNVAFSGNLTQVNSLSVGAGNSISGRIQIKPYAANNVGIVVQGYASQTADLQQWQDSAGTVLNSITSDGTFKFKNSVWHKSVTDGQDRFYYEPYSSSFYKSANAHYFRNSTDTTFLTINNVGNVLVNGFTASTVGLTVKGAASQTANLQEWHNSDGTVLSRITNGGGLRIESLVASSIGGAAVAGTILLVHTNQPANLGLVVKGAASQTASLQEWQNSSGTMLASITDTGFSTAILKIPYIYTYAIQGWNGVGGSIEFANATPITIKPQSASVVNLVIKGAASQSANLQEWQNSTGTVLANIGANGAFTSNVQGSATSLISISQASLTKFEINQYGQSWNATKSTFGNYYNTDSGTLPQVSILSSTADAKGLVVRGAASQTANLQEWQGSGGNTLSVIDAYGALYLQDTAMIAPIGNWATDRFATGGLTIINRGTTSQIPLGIRGKVAQTADLTQWQNSAGTVIAEVNSYGGAEFVDLKIGTTSSLGSLGIVPGVTTQKGLVVRALASQTANLTEWQDSAGTVLASISPAGKLTSAVDASINGLKIGLGSASISSNLAFGANSLNGNTTGNNNIAIGGASLFSNTTGSSNTAIGSAALYANTVGGGNMAIGFEALNQNIDGNYNTAIGSQSLRNSNTANYNVSIGLQSMYYNTSGASNTSIGSVALLSNTSGNANIAIGYGALYSNTSGYNNTAIGANAGYSNVTGIQNVFIGSSAGYNETGSNKLYIANTNTATPLIGGDFSAKTLTIAGNASIISQNASSTGLLVKAAVSQTGSIIQWQNSSGTTIGEINNQGIFRNTYNYVQNLQGLGGGSGLYLNDVTTTAFNANPAHLVFKVQGFASQTANLQEWQNSSGTALVSINADGSSNFNNIMQVKETWGGVALSVSALLGQSNPVQGWYTIDSNGDNKTEIAKIDINGQLAVKSVIGNTSSTISANTATTVDTVALSSFTTTEYTISIKQGSKVRSSKVLVHTDGTSVDSTEYGIIEMGGGITGILVTASVSSTNSILQVTITDAATTNATVKLIKTML